MKKKIRKIIQFLTNPRLLLCLLIAWFITNGWSYLALAIGTAFGINWLTAVASAYLAFLWLPVSPEKIVTVAIAIALMKKLFPDDRRTLAVLKVLRKNIKKVISKHKEK